jgi:hypothetical protein
VDLATLLDLLRDFPEEHQRRKLNRLLRLSPGQMDENRNSQRGQPQ